MNTEEITISKGEMKWLCKIVGDVADGPEQGVYSTDDLKRDLSKLKSFFATYNLHFYHRLLE